VSFFTKKLAPAKLQNVHSFDFSYVLGKSLHFSKLRDFVVKNSSKRYFTISTIQEFLYRLFLLGIFFESPNLSLRTEIPSSNKVNIGVGLILAHNNLASDCVHCV